MKRQATDKYKEWQNTITMNKLIKCIIILSFITTSISYSDDRMWKWVDDNGGVHYTDNISNVPPKYRSSAEGLTIYSLPSSQRRSNRYTPPLPPISPPQKIKKLLSETDISILEKFINHIAKEVERDTEIIEMVNNEIAIRMTLGFLQRDWPIKNKLFKTLKKIRNLNISEQINWLSKNIEMEFKIVNTMLNPNNTFEFMAAKNLIRQAIPGKKNLLNVLRPKIQK